MPRTGVLVAAAVLLAAGAAALLMWTNFFGTKSQNTTRIATADSTLAGSNDAVDNWTQTMSEITSSGGIALTFDDSRIKEWLLPPQHRLERFSIANSHTVFVRLTSTSALSNEPPNWNERGLGYQFPTDWAAKSNGRKIEIGVIARQSQSNGSPSLSIVYATQQAGNSGWQKFDLNGEFKLFKFQYDVPSVPDGYIAAPIVLMHSDAEGAGRSVEILGLYVKVL